VALTQELLASHASARLAGAARGAGCTAGDQQVHRPPAASEPSPDNAKNDFFA